MKTSKSLFSRSFPNLFSPLTCLFSSKSINPNSILPKCYPFPQPNSLQFSLRNAIISHHQQPIVFAVRTLSFVSFNIIFFRNLQPIIVLCLHICN
ncbi:hypothetical protein Hanom_Chr01g00003641 [Helianthus anomalus]